VNAAVSRQVTSEEFGRFSVIYLFLYFGMASIRAIYGEPQLLTTYLPESKSGAINRWAVGSGALTAVALGVAETVVLISIFRSAWLIIVVLVLPSLVLQDVLRYVAFALGKPHIAAASDIAVLLPLPLLLVWTPSHVPIEVLAVGLWAVSCLVSAALASRFVLTGPPLIRVRRYWGLSRSAAIGSMTEFAATALVFIVPVTLIPLTASLSDTATVRVLQMVFSPITIVHAAAFTLLAPRITHRTLESGRGMGGLLSLYAFFLSAATIGWTAILAAVPSLGSWLFPSSYEDARSVLTSYLIVQLMGVALGTVTLGLRATNTYRGLVRIRIVFAALTPLAAVWAVGAHGVGGFCVALVLMQVPVLIVGFRLLSKFGHTARGNDA